MSFVNDHNNHRRDSSTSAYEIVNKRPRLLSATETELEQLHHYAEPVPAQDGSPGAVAEGKALAQSLQSFRSTPSLDYEFRFIFDLIQKADEAAVSHTSSYEGEPFIYFQVHPSHIIVESSEKAIFEEFISESPSVSPHATDSHNASKGMEYMFAVASSVLVEVGNRVVRLEQHGAGSEVGISKHSQDAENRNEQEASRMTMKMLGLNGRTEADMNIRSDLLQQLQEVRSICPLLFNQLSRVSVSFYDSTGSEVSFEGLSLKWRGNDNVKIQQESRKAGATPRQTTKYYHVKRASSAKQTSSPGPEPRTRPNLCIGFPSTAEGFPDHRKEDVYSFLALGGQGFEFMIQADFKMDSSGRSVLKDSQHNVGLLDGIASAFIDTIQDFDNCPILRYTWPRYIPQPADVADPFWLGLVERIQTRSTNFPLLRTFRRDNLRLIGEARLPGNRDVYELGNQQLDSWISRPFMTDNHASPTMQPLESYGLGALDMHELFALLRDDLRSHDSLMKSKTTNNAWHSRVAHLLSLNFTQLWTENIPALREIPFIPLRDGSWTSAASGAIFWPSSHGIFIPTVSRMRIVDDMAVENLERRRLFELLGVQEAAISDIRSWIVDEYRSMRGVTLNECSDHLHFLYLTHAYRQSDTDLSQMGVLTQDYRIVRPNDCDVYVPGASRFGPEILLNPLINGDGAKDRPGISTAFVHPLLLEDTPLPPTPTHLTWRRWMIGFLGVREHIRLVSASGGAISHTFLYVVETQPHNIMGTLRAAWKSQGAIVSHSPVLREAIRKILVPCQNGTMYPLWETYLPLPHLRQQRAQFLTADEFFPFLDLEEDNTSAEVMQRRWSFLMDDLAVCTTDSVSFLLDILGYAQEANPRGMSIERCRTFIRVYCEIEARCAEHPDPENAMKIVRDYVSDIGGILVPSVSTLSAKWAMPGQCLWDAPISMSTKHPLRAMYEMVLQCTPAEMRSLTSFFRQTLGIPSINWFDVTNEMAQIRARCYAASTRRQLEFPRKTFNSEECVRKYLRRLLQGFDDIPLATIEGGH